MLTLSVASAAVRVPVPIVEGVVPMSDEKPALDLSDLAVESIEVVAADSLDSANYGHGMPELDASCRCGVGGCVGFSCFMPDDPADE